MRRVEARDCGFRRGVSGTIRSRLRSRSDRGALPSTSSSERQTQHNPQKNFPHATPSLPQYQKHCLPDHGHSFVSRSDANRSAERKQSDDGIGNTLVLGVVLAGTLDRA